MTTVILSLLTVVVLSLAVNAAPAATPAAAAVAYYYEPIVPYGPYPAPGYVVSTYVPQYTGYPVMTPVGYRPRKTDYDEDPNEDDEPKYYYGGKFKGND